MSHRRRRRNRRPRRMFAETLNLLAAQDYAAPSVDAEWVRTRHCRSKVRRSRDGARAVAHRMNHEKPGESFEAYRCVFCHAWHVGHVASMESLRDLALVVRGGTSR